MMGIDGRDAADGGNARDGGDGKICQRYEEMTRNQEKATARPPSRSFRSCLRPHIALMTQVASAAV